MTKRLVSFGREAAWLDIVSHGRRGPDQSAPLGPQHHEAIARTTGNVPEVMVKVTGGGRNVQQVKDEIGYFGRNGAIEIETDDGERLVGEGIPTQLVNDWNLELEELQGRTPYTGTPGRRSPKVVYNLLFSMPPGTQPQKVLAAAKKFAFEKFALSHRYAMVLHTDRKHPHVHMLVKAKSEQGIRLHITRPILREWRQSFARYLRELNVPANASDRKSRGQTQPRKKDSIYRAHLRGESTHMRARAERVAAELARGRLQPEPGKADLLKTREEVRRGWIALSKQFAAEGETELANQVTQFMASMPEPKTENEHTATQLIAAHRARQPDRIPDLRHV